MAYEERFRRRVLAYKDSGHTFAEVHEAFGVHSQQYYQWKKQLNEKGNFEHKYPKEHAGKIDPAKLAGLLDKHPDWYLSEFAAEFNVRPQSVQKRFAKPGVTRKKNVHLFRKVRREAESICDRHSANTQGKPGIC